MKRIDLTGLRFGRLKVLRFTGRQDSRGNGYWRCKCSCGELRVVLSVNLKSGKSKSCGQHTVFPIKHGHRKGHHRSREYQSWQDMHKRCTNPNSKDYKNWGGRGIKVCKRWTGEHGFEKFFADLGPCPKDMTLHRIDNDGDYRLGNCKWATWEEQAANRRRYVA